MTLKSACKMSKAEPAGLSLTLEVKGFEGPLKARLAMAKSLMIGELEGTRMLGLISGS